MWNKGLSKCVVRLSMDKEILKQLKYMITTFSLFWEDHSDDSVIYDLLELQTLSFISYYSSFYER